MIRLLIGILLIFQISAFCVRANGEIAIIENGRIKNLEYLKRFPHISFEGNEKLVDSSILAELKGCKILNLRNTPLTEINGLKNFKFLEYLKVDNTKVVDFSPVKKLKVRYISASGNGIKDLNSLKDFRYLAHLDVSVNKIKDIKICSKFRYLEEINISYTEVADLKPLQYLKKLKVVHSAYNKVGSIKAISTNQRELEEIDISGLQLSDFSPLSKVTTLKLIIMNDSSISDSRHLKKSLHHLDYVSLINSKLSARDLADLLKSSTKTKCKIGTSWDVGNWKEKKKENMEKFNSL